MASQKEIARLIITLEGQIQDLKKNFSLVDTELTKIQKKHKNVFADIKKNWLLYTAAIAGATIALQRFAGPFASFKNRMLEVNTLVRLSNKELRQMDDDEFQGSSDELDRIDREQDEPRLHNEREEVSQETEQTNGPKEPDAGPDETSKEN